MAESSSRSEGAVADPNILGRSISGIAKRKDKL
jgi:hypothetical protein